MALPIPRTGEDCERLLEQARSRMRVAEVRLHFAKELSRFLGAGSAVWTSARREALQELLASAGEDAIDPVLRAVMQTPRAEVTDDAEAVLAAIGRGSNALLEQLVARLDNAAAPSMRAVLIRSLSHVGKPISRAHFETALNDDDADVRDAAAIALGQLRLRDAKPALARRLEREKNPVVRESIKSAVEELENA